MTITDVNAALAARRTASWDRTEYQGKDGLDTTLGQAALYTSTPAWHSLGTVIPGGTDNIDDVLKLGGIEFGVEKRAARYSFMADGDQSPTLRTAPDHFVTVRTDTGADLGVVGRKYTPIQNRDLFVFLQDLVDNHGVIWESAGALRGGKRVFVTMRLPENVRIDADGINDEIVPFVVMLNSHDGRSPAQALVTPWRVVCANTERFAVRDAHTSWRVRHTASALTRIDEARRTLGLSMEYYQEWVAEETVLAQTAITLDEFDKLITDLWPVKENAKPRTLKSAERRRDMLNDIFRAETLGQTAYGAERTVTYFTDHIRPCRPGKSMTEEIARATALLEGADDEIKTKAHKQLMLLARR